MADSISIPPTSNNAVETATTGALSGDGTSISKLSVNVDGTTIGVNGSNELKALGGSNPFDQDLNTDDDVQFASVSVGSATTGDLLTSGGSIAVGDPGMQLIVTSTGGAWLPNTNLGSFGDDVIVTIEPSGSSNTFFAEFSDAVTGATEPDWASAPDPGDSVSDGDVTWYNEGPQASYPPTPQTWQPNHVYTAPVLIWPTVPNGHVYTPYYYTFTSGGSEPTWPTNFGEYVSDNDGYWMDLGTNGVATQPTFAQVLAVHPEILRTGAPVIASEWALNVTYPTELGQSDSSPALFMVTADDNFNDEPTIVLGRDAFGPDSVWTPGVKHIAIWAKSVESGTGSTLDLRAGSSDDGAGGPVNIYAGTSVDGGAGGSLFFGVGQGDGANNHGLVDFFLLSNGPSTHHLQFTAEASGPTIQPGTTDDALNLRGNGTGGLNLITSGALSINGTPGVTAGPFSVITSIATTKGVVTTLTGT